MSRLIDADALKSEIEQYIRNVERFHEYEMIHAYEDCCSAIDEQPTISPKKGKWKVTPIYIQCSECGESFMLIPQNYCPNCGAKMDEVTE